MKIFQLNQQTAKSVTHFRSAFLIQPLLQLDAGARVSIVTLKEKGVIGFHQADVPQMLIVVEGEGFVCDDSKKFTKIHVGLAVFWEKGEWHETRTDTGLVAIVIESEKITDHTILLKSVE